MHAGGAKTHLGACGKARHRKITLVHLFILVAALLPYVFQHVPSAILLHLASQQQLFKDEVGFLEFEEDVRLADIAVISVHLLDVAVDNLECDKFVVG